MRVELPPLTQEESGEMLQRLGVASRWHSSIAQFADGHPLLLALAASLEDPKDAADGGVETGPDLVQDLLRRLVDQAPSPRHCQALVISAVARRTTEALLQRLLGADATDFFEWLWRRNYVSTDAEGISPHDIVRDVVRADFKWRGRSTYDRLLQGLHDDVVTRLREDPTGPAARDIVVLMTERRTPWARLMLHPRGLDLGLVRHAKAADWPEVEAIATAHGGPSAPHWMKFWHEHGATTKLISGDDGTLNG